MSLNHEDIKIPENVFNECMGLYNDVLTFSKQKTLERLIRHAYIAGTNHNDVKDEE